MVLYFLTMLTLKEALHAKK